MSALKQSLQLRLIQVFSVLQCGRKQQMDIIEQALGVRKNITAMNVDELNQVLYEITGNKEGVAV